MGEQAESMEGKFNCVRKHRNWIMNNNGRVNAIKIHLLITMTALATSTSGSDKWQCNNSLDVASHENRVRVERHQRERIELRMVNATGESATRKKRDER